MSKGTLYLYTYIPFPRLRLYLNSSYYFYYTIYFIMKLFCGQKI